MEKEGERDKERETGSEKNGERGQQDQVTASHAQEASEESHRERESPGEARSAEEQHREEARATLEDSARWEEEATASALSLPPSLCKAEDHELLAELEAYRLDKGVWERERETLLAQLTALQEDIARRSLEQDERRLTGEERAVGGENKRRQENES